MRLKKNLIIGLAGLILILSMISGCGNSIKPDSPTGYLISDGDIMLDKEGTIPAELSAERGLDNRIIVLESKYCGACQEALPVIKEVAAELNAPITYVDLSEADGQAELKQLKVLPYYTPTVLVSGQVYIGGKTKKEYTKIFSDFLEKQG